MIQLFVFADFSSCPFPLISQREMSIIKMPAICKSPVGSCQKIGPATEGMIIPYITQIDVVDIAPTRMAVIEIVCRLITIAA